MTDPAVAPEPGPWLAQALGKTEAGRREITERALPLSRAARNLLLIIDPQRSAGQWLALVRGCGPAELQQLLGAGLVGPSAAAGTAPGTDVPAGAASAAVLPVAAALAGAPPIATRLSLPEALQALGYQLLYDRLTSEARRQLGLFKGYRLILDIEKCSGPPELRALALQFVEQIRVAKGDVEALALAQRLVDPG